MPCIERSYVGCCDGQIKNFKSLNELLEYISLEEFLGFVKLCDIRTLLSEENFKNYSLHSF